MNTNAIQQKNVIAIYSCYLKIPSNILRKGRAKFRRTIRCNVRKNQ